MLLCNVFWCRAVVNLSCMPKLWNHETCEQDTSVQPNSTCPTSDTQLDPFLFQNFFGGHVRTLPGSIRAKFKVRNFSHFGSVNTWPWPRPLLPLLTFRGWQPPRDFVWTMNRYNRSTDNAREVFQYSQNSFRAENRINAMFISVK